MSQRCESINLSNELNFRMKNQMTGGHIRLLNNVLFERRDVRLGDVMVIDRRRGLRHVLLGTT